MITLREAASDELNEAMAIINAAKRHLKAQGIDQWQTGYPDEACIRRDIAAQKGFFIVDRGEGNAEGEDGEGAEGKAVREEILGYLCIDFDGEPAYEGLKGAWHTQGAYVVIHRMAFSEFARGRGLSARVFPLVEDMSRRRGVHACRVDTDADNGKMLHILRKNGFAHCGTIWFDNSEKVAFDKVF